MSMETIFMQTENSKTCEPHRLVLSLPKRLDFKNSDKNLRQHYKNNKLKIITPPWNNEFELPDGSYSVSDIQDYIEYIKSMKHLSTIFLLIFT